ncbi:TetR/AcrR family transcriptional regulator [Streptomyces lonarensis]|uniref:TetR/AcrR family transcriptional regulator n=1 Tax=Streptomyces lonarensis TaxID=700599 RepID=A0A7X6D603_9ACTN|nr:TetR/AcrR family transcriptional regulator [Streptomyces lonarensis]NJQ08809.1 TetR/AcrR family transcriptional regulator [Streptomyces lonarensis]
MRPSSRSRILDAAVHVVARDGITSLTLDAAAEEAGVTKGGLIYHFPSRDALLRAIQAHLTTRWEALLLAELAVPFEEADASRRAAAYAAVCAGGGTGGADLAFMMESATDPALAEAWTELTRRWVAPPASAGPAEIDRLVARLAADGLWLGDSVGGGADLDPAVRAAVVRRILELTGAAPSVG